MINFLVSVGHTRQFEMFGVKGRKGHQNIFKIILTNKK